MLFLKFYRTMDNFVLRPFSFISYMNIKMLSIFFIPIVFLYLIIENKIEKFDLKLIKIISLITPVLFLSFYIIFKCFKSFYTYMMLKTFSVTMSYFWSNANV